MFVTAPVRVPMPDRIPLADGANKPQLLTGPCSIANRCGVR